MLITQGIRATLNGHKELYDSIARAQESDIRILRNSLQGIINYLKEHSYYSKPSYIKLKRKY